jgi:anthranilate/para-aminobenzoate synthase component II
LAIVGNHDFLKISTNKEKAACILQNKARGAIEAIRHERRHIYGVQAQIERASCENHDGWQILKNFISDVVVK